MMSNARAAGRSTRRHQPAQSKRRRITAVLAVPAGPRYSSWNNQEKHHLYLLNVRHPGFGSLRDETAVCCLCFYTSGFIGSDEGLYVWNDDVCL